MSIDLHPAQSEIFRDLFVDKSCRNAVGVCSRGFGKSFLAGATASAAVFELMQLEPWVPNKNVVIIAPTYSQVTDIYHPLLAYQLGLEQYAIKHSRDLGRFWFPNDVTLKLMSFEAVERLRGTGAYFVVNDEVILWQKGIGFKKAWEGVIQPCLTTRWSPQHAKRYKAVSPGRSLTISTPKGYDFLYDMFHFHERDDLWKSYHFDYTCSPFLDPIEIERTKHTIDPLEFAREYLASFEESGNRVFYCFDRKTHVSKDISRPGDEEDLHIAIDFNVNLQCSSVWTIRGRRVECHEELKGAPDTESLAKILATRYKNGKRRVFCYPDPSGNSRKTSAVIGTTDFSILKSHGLTVLARDAHPKIVDSVQSVNRKLKTAAGEVDVAISPYCTGVIESLERTAWLDNNPDTASIDKKEGIEHYSDGVRYFFEYKFPVTHVAKRAHRSFGF